MTALKITVDGASATSGAASATIAIPVGSDGVRARTVLITAEGLTHFLPGVSTVVATTASTLIEPGHPIGLDVMGLTHIAILESVAAQLVVVTPVET